MTGENKIELYKYKKADPIDEYKNSLVEIAYLFATHYGLSMINPKGAKMEDVYTSSILPITKKDIIVHSVLDDSGKILRWVLRLPYPIADTTQTSQKMLGYKLGGKITRQFTTMMSKPVIKNDVLQGVPFKIRWEEYGTINVVNLYYYLLSNPSADVIIHKNGSLSDKIPDVEIFLYGNQGIVKEAIEANEELFNKTRKKSLQKINDLDSDDDNIVNNRNMQDNLSMGKDLSEAIYGVR